MRLDQENPSDRVEDQRGRGFGRGGFGFPGGRRIVVPMGGRGGFGLSTILLLVLIYFAAKLLFGIDLADIFTRGGGSDSRRSDRHRIQPSSRRHRCHQSG